MPIFLDRHDMVEQSAEETAQLHVKDLEICRDMASARDVKLPIVEMTLVHYRRLLEENHGDEDISSLFRIKAAMYSGNQR